MDIRQILKNALLGTDPAVRADAEAQMAVAAREHFVPYLAMLNDALCDEGTETDIRQLAALALKNLLIAKDARTSTQMAERWLSVDADAKAKIRETALNALSLPNERVAMNAAQLVAAIAMIELPRGEWLDLKTILVANTRSEMPAHVKRMNLLTIGYICESADPQNRGIVQQMDGLLTAIIQGAQSSEPDPTVRLTAINALVDSLEFIRLNFDMDNERHYIMQVVCEATQGQTVELQAAAFGALGRIMSLYYQYMKTYMEQALYGLTVDGMLSANENVASMAVEFWSTVCEEEIDIDMDMEYSINSDRTNYHFAQNALQQILPTVLHLLTRQDEDADDDEWNVAMAAGSCLQLLATNTKDAVIPQTLEFIKTHLTSTEWANREAAVMAFGSILMGPDTTQLRPLITEGLHPLLALMNDHSTHVVDTVAWCLGRVAHLVTEAISLDSDLPEMIKALLKGITIHPKVSTNCCWAIMNLAEQLSYRPYQDTCPMSQYYSLMIPALVESSSRPDNEYSSRTSAYEALSTLVQNSQNDVQDAVLSLSGTVLSRLESTMSMQNQIVSADDRTNLEELQTNLLALLANIIRRVGDLVRPAAERLMTLFLQLLQNKLPNSVVDEDVFIGVGAVADAIGTDFGIYAGAFMEYLVNALRIDPNGGQISGTAVGLVADIAHAIGPQMTQFTPVIMNHFMLILQDNDIPREIKPTVLSCIGDIASSIGAPFGEYLTSIAEILRQGALIQYPEDASIETLDYILSLREAILDSYVGIVAGMRDHAAELRPFIADALQFVQIVHVDPDLCKSEQTLRSAVGLLGDIASMYPQGPFQTVYSQPWVSEMIKKARDKTLSSATRDTGKWAREQQKVQLALP